MSGTSTGTFRRAGVEPDMSFIAEALAANSDLPVTGIICAALGTVLLALKDGIVRRRHLHPPARSPRHRA